MQGLLPKFPVDTGDELTVRRSGELSSPMTDAYKHIHEFTRNHSLLATTMEDVETPLLQQDEAEVEEEEAVEKRKGGVHGGGGFFEGCPGCLMELRKKAGRAPTKELSFVALFVLCAALPISSLFPFLYFMVRDFSIAESDTSIAYYAGFIGSAPMFGRFVASAPWGLIADRFGCKPVIICGTASIVVFNTAFGFSTTYWMALVSRLLLGIFNGLIVTMRAYVSDICTEKDQAFGMSLLSTMWGFGLIVGPAIGGFLAQPSAQYPSLFPAGSIFDRFPYALPCVCISAFAAISLVLSFWVPENLHRHPATCATGTVEGYDGIESSDKDCWEQENVENHNILKTNSKKKSLLRNRGLVSAMLLSCIWNLHDMAYTELFSLWAESPGRYGGLDMTTSNVGVILAISGGMLLAFQSFIYSWLQNMLGPIKASRISSVLSVPLVLIYPLMARLDGTLLWGVVIFASILKTLLSASVNTASYILINNSVTSDRRGLANGVSMSLISLFRAIAPTCAGYILSWAESRVDASFLPGMWMVFSILALTSFMTVLTTFEPIMPRHLDNPSLKNLDALRS